MKILLFSPKTPNTFWSFKHVLRFVARKAAFPPLGLLTVAAMLPRDWELKLVDLNVEHLEDADILWADYVLLSAMIVQQESVREVARRCAAAGKPVIAGGPCSRPGTCPSRRFPTLSSGRPRRSWPRWSRTWAPARCCPPTAPGYPSLDRTPMPRYDLIKLRNYVTMAAQFSRGCPYDCEFCDIIVMNGRVPRTKAPAQLVAELEALRLMGWNDMVFIVDDNFIGNKARTKALLAAMIEWRERTHP